MMRIEAAILVMTTILATESLASEPPDPPQNLGETYEVHEAYLAEQQQLSSYVDDTNEWIDENYGNWSLQDQLVFMYYHAGWFRMSQANACRNQAEYGLNSSLQHLGQGNWQSAWGDLQLVSGFIDDSYSWMDPIWVAYPESDPR